MPRNPRSDLSVPFGDDELKNESDLWVIEMVKRVVRANSQRDQDLNQLRQQLEGVSQPTSDGPFPNACMIQDPTPWEFHSTVHSNVSAAFRAKPWVTLEALRARDEQVVQKIETMGNVEAELFGFGKALDTVTYNILESRFAVCGVFYDTYETKRKELVDVPILPAAEGEETPAEPMEGELLPSTVETETERQLYEFRSVTENFTFRPIDSWDFYMDPVGAHKVQDADHTVERVWLTRSQLRRGVKNEDFDKEAIDKLLVRGPTAVQEDNSPRRDQMDLAGIQEDVPAYYECFRVIGTMPELSDSDGKPRMPDRFLDEDFLWMVCPAHGIVFKRTYIPFPVRPYAVGKAMGVDTELCGHGVVSILSALSDENSILMRALIDGTTITMNPMMKVPMQLAGWYSQKDRRQAGGILPYQRDVNEIQPLMHDLSGLQLALEVLQWNYNRCAQLVAAQGVNTSMGGKQRKAAEVQMMAEVLKNKFATIVANVGRMVEEIFRIYFAMRKHYMTDSVSFRMGAEDGEVKRDDMEAEYRIIPHADADNASSIARRENDQALAQFCMNNPLFIGEFQNGNRSPMWMLGSRILGHMGINNVEAFLGKQPVPGDPQDILASIMPIIQQGLQQQPPDPVSQMVMQIVQRQQQLAQGQGEQAPSGHEIQPGSGLNMSAMPGSPGPAQTALMNGSGVT